MSNLIIPAGPLIASPGGPPKILLQNSITNVHSGAGNVTGIVSLASIGVDYDHTVEINAGVICNAAQYFCGSFRRNGSDQLEFSSTAGAACSVIGYYQVLRAWTKTKKLLINCNTGATVDTVIAELTPATMGRALVINNGMVSNTAAIGGYHTSCAMGLVDVSGTVKLRVSTAANTSGGPFVINVNILY